MAAEHDISRQGFIPRARVLEKIKQMVAEEAGIPPGQIQETDHLEDDLGLDSLDIAEMAMEVEETFGIELSDEIEPRTATVASVTDAVIAALHRTGV